MHFNFLRYCVFTSSGTTSSSTSRAWTISLSLCRSSGRPFCFEADNFLCSRTVDEVAALMIDPSKLVSTDRLIAVELPDGTRAFFGDFKRFFDRLAARRASRTSFSDRTADFASLYPDVAGLSEGRMGDVDEGFITSSWARKINLEILFTLSIKCNSVNTNGQRIPLPFDIYMIFLL